MKAYLPALFQLFFAVSVIVFFFIAARWRARIYALKGHLFLISLALVPLVLFFLSSSLTSTRSEQSATLMLLGGLTLAVQVAALRRFTQAAPDLAAPDLVAQAEGCN